MNFLWELFMGTSDGNFLIETSYKNFLWDILMGTSNGNF